MIRTLTFVAALALAAPAMAEEKPVDPYPQSNANAGATPFEGDAMLKAFHGQAGISRIIDEMVDRNVHDPVIGEFFKTTDLERLRRTLKEQVCYILNGGCAYTGRDMKMSHKDQGVQNTDFNRLVENLQIAMDHEKVSFRAQNKLLAKLAPMQRTTVER